MTCERCGDALGVGSWPFCRGAGSHTRGSIAVENVTWPGGKTFENLANEPVTFYHRSDYDKYLRTHNIEECVRHMPVPGSDKSPHTTSWACISQETLDGAKAMLERTNTAGAPDHPGWVQSMTVTVTTERGTITAPRGTFDAT